MTLVGPELETDEANRGDPVVEAGLEAEPSMTGAWTTIVMSVWRLVEVLYGPCFAPLGGTWTLMDGNGLMMSCADAPEGEEAGATTERAH